MKYLLIALILMLTGCEIKGHFVYRCTQFCAHKEGIDSMTTTGVCICRTGQYEQY